jgi:DNA-binding NarL/FixJ family response regulator
MSDALPGVLGEIASVAGEAAALQLAAEKGGTRVYIPARCSEAHWLVNCVGRAAAEKMCAHFAVEGKRGAEIMLPLADAGAFPRFRRAMARRIHQLDRQGKSSSEIARAAGVNQRTVHKHRARHRGGRKSDQGSLF